MSKQGGKGKKSSQSDINYWSRAKMLDFAGTHKKRRIARHENRMAKKAARRFAWEQRQRKHSNALYAA